MKKKIIRPKHSDRSNTNIKILAEETSEKLCGIDNVIPPKPEEPKVELKYDSSDLFIPLVSAPRFSDNFYDCFLAISFSMGFIMCGVVLGLSMH